MITLIFYKDNIGHYFSDFLQLLEDRHVRRSAEQTLLEVSEEHSEMEEREHRHGGGSLTDVSKSYLKVYIFSKFILYFINQTS